MKTRTEAVTWLTEQGHNLALAKAMVHGVFCMPHDNGDTDDLLRGWEFDSVEDAVIELTPIELEEWWKSTIHEFEIKEDGIYLFGDLAYDLEGNCLVS
jgi:hypothetical protein